MHINFPKTFLNLVFAASMCCFGAAPTLAQSGPITAAEDAANRMNIAGRQRMLSQRIGMASCFLHLGIETEANLNILETATEEFAEALYALRFGSEDMRMLRPTDPTVEKIFAPVIEMWLPFSSAIGRLEADPSKSGPANYISRNSVKLLTFSQEAVALMSSIYGGSAISVELARTIDVAGRQRMLSQRMAKGFCEVLRDPENETARQDFVTAFDLFNRSHLGLLAGDPGLGVIAPPTGDIILQLTNVDMIWSDIRNDLEMTAIGVPPSPAVIDRIFHGTNTLLREMNIAVGLYSKIVSSGS